MLAQVFILIIIITLFKGGRFWTFTSSSDSSGDEGGDSVLPEVDPSASGRGKRVKKKIIRKEYI